MLGGWLSDRIGSLKAQLFSMNLSAGVLLPSAIHSTQYRDGYPVEHCGWWAAVRPTLRH
jgi:nitrate/nitrite transporter NarK